MPLGVYIAKGGRQRIGKVTLATLQNPEASTPSTVTVANSETEIIAQNTDRAQLIIRNTDATNPVYLAYNDTFTASDAPIKLDAGLHWIEDVWDGPIYGLAPDGNVDVAVQEITEPDDT